MLYIVTPLSRLLNLVQINESFKKSSSYDDWDFLHFVIVDNKLSENDKQHVSILMEREYHSLVRFSPYSNSFVGHSHRNWFINEVFLKKPLEHTFQTDWVYFLDDDTLLHPDFLETILPLLESNSDKAAIIFDQENKDGSMRLFANINQVKVCHIDMGQYIVNLSKLPSDLRFKENDYCADGIFIEELFNRVGPEQFIVVNKTLSTYNKLR